MSMYRILYLGRKLELTEPALEMLWAKIQADGLAETLFYDGSVRSEYDFICSMMNRNTCPYLVTCDGKFALFSWLNGAEGRAMRIHFTMFKESWGGKRNAVDVARHFVSYVLTLKDADGYLLDALYGLTPTSNRLACRFVQRAGMDKIGILPNAVSLFFNENRTDNALVTCATRESLGIGPDGNVEATWNV